jgi:hypothetical protein
MSHTCSQCGDVESHGCLDPVDCPYREHLAKALEYTNSPALMEYLKDVELKSPTLLGSVYAKNRIALTLPKMHRQIIKDLQEGKYDWVTEQDLKDDFSIELKRYEDRNAPPPRGF